MTADLTASQRLRAESMHMSVEVRIAADKIDELETENEKLRELVRDMHACINRIEANSCDCDCPGCTLDGVAACDFEGRMESLGVEVES